MYTCSVCGAIAQLDENNNIIRTCNCTREVIIDGKSAIKPSTLLLDCNADLIGDGRIKL